MRLSARLKNKFRGFAGLALLLLAGLSCSSLLRGASFEQILATRQKLLSYMEECTRGSTPVAGEAQSFFVDSLSTVKEAQEVLQILGSDRGYSPIDPSTLVLKQLFTKAAPAQLLPLFAAFIAAGGFMVVSPLTFPANERENINYTLFHNFLLHSSHLTNEVLLPLLALGTAPEHSLLPLFADTLSQASTREFARCWWERHSPELLRYFLDKQQWQAAIFLLERLRHLSISLLVPRRGLVPSGELAFSSPLLEEILTSMAENLVHLYPAESQAGDERPAEQLLSSLRQSFGSSPFNQEQLSRAKTLTSFAHTPLSSKQGKHLCGFLGSGMVRNHFIHQLSAEIAPQLSLGSKNSEFFTKLVAFFTSKHKHFGQFAVFNGYNELFFSSAAPHSSLFAIALRELNFRALEYIYYLCPQPHSG